MTQIKAIYQGGVFKPLESVDLSEDKQVRLIIQPIETGNVERCRARAQELQRRLCAQHALFPDSVLDIAEDRRR